MHSKEKPDPKDILIQTELYNAYEERIRGSVKKEIADAMNRAAPLDPASVKQMRGSSFSHQLGELLKRTFKNLIRNKHFIQARIMQTVVVSVLLDLLFNNKDSWDRQDVRDKNSVLFFICTSQLMFTMQSVILSCKIA